jgi:AcrR family transcriptional regulator
MNERSFILKGRDMAEQSLKRGEQTRDAIIQAAHDLFVQQGYHGTSMRQIAGKAHLALGGLYNHFASKDEVFEAVFLEYHPYRQVLPAVLAMPADSIEQFARDTIRRMLDAIHGQPEFMNLMFIEVVEFKSIHTQKLFRILMPQVIQMVQHLMALNSDRLKPIPAPMLLRVYFGQFFGFYLTEIILTDQYPAEFREGAVDYFIDIFLHGVMRENAPAEARP